MSIGTGIIVSSEPRGRFIEGTIGDTSKPGTLMQVKAATEKIGGEWTYIAYAPSADGDPRPALVLCEDDLQGVTATTAYTNGARCKIYAPAPGELLNMLIKDIAGTADTHAIGDRFKGDHSSGKLIVEATSANRAPWTLMETSAALTADTLLCCMFGPY